MTAANAELVLRRFIDAMERHDLDGLLETFSSDVVLRSPNTARVTFRGRDELRELMHVHFSVVHDVSYRRESLGPGTDTLVYTGIVRGQPVEIVNRVELDDDHLIDEITIYVRPLPGLTALAAALGPPIARTRRSAAHALLLRAALSPLAFVTAAADRLAGRFA